MFYSEGGAIFGQGYVKERLKSSLRKFYCRYRDLTKQYEVPPLPNVTRHSEWWPYTVTPPLIRNYTNFWPLLIWTLLPNLTVYLIVQCVHRTYATGAACQQRTLTPPDTWSCTLWDLHMFICRDQSLLNLSCFRTFEFRGWWRYTHIKRRNNSCIIRFAHDTVFLPFWGGCFHQPKIVHALLNE